MVQNEDHLRSGIICCPGIICGTVWGSFAVLGSFADPYRSKTQVTGQVAGQVNRKNIFLPMTIFTFPIQVILLLGLYHAAVNCTSIVLMQILTPLPK